jgi:hypothetical protein
VDACDAEPSPRKSRYEESLKVSMMKLIETTNLTREEIGRGLYSLQKQGVISYSLCCPALYITIDESKLSPLINNAGSLRSWLMNISQQLHEKLHSLISIATNGVHNMWRIGKLIGIRSHNQEIVHNVIHSTVNQTKSTDGPNTHQVNGHITLEEIDLPLEITHPSISSSVSSLISDGKFRKNIFRLVQNASDSDYSEAQLSIERSLLALTICRILQGLSSPLFPQEEWIENPSWNQNRSNSFGTIENMIIEYLKDQPRIITAENCRDISPS